MRRRFKDDNRGIALISVMICVMLSFLLSATILRISLLSYLQKGVAKQTASTFYENEEFLDDIKMGVQQKVAEAFSSSLSAGADDSEGFFDYFSAAMLSGVSGDDDDEDVSVEEQYAVALRSFINDTTAAKVKNITIESVVEPSEADPYFVLRGVTIEYIDNTNNGYYSKIKTDIRIKSPYYTVEPGEPATSSKYTMLAGGGSSITCDGQDTVLQVAGSYYSGYQNDNYKSVGVTNNVATSVELKGSSGRGTICYFTESEEEKTERQAARAVYNAAKKAGSASLPALKEPNSVVFNGDLYIKGGSKVVFLCGNVIVRGTIYISSNSMLIVGDKTNLTCRDIVINYDKSSKISVATGTKTGTVTIKNDHLPYPQKFHTVAGINDPTDNNTKKNDFSNGDFDYTNKGGFFIAKKKNAPASDSLDTAEDETDLRDSVKFEVSGSTGNEKLEVDGLGAVVKEASFNKGVVSGAKITITSGEITDVVPNDGPFSNECYYDHEYCSIVDVEWLLTGISSQYHEESWGSYSSWIGDPKKTTNDSARPKEDDADYKDKVKNGKYLITVSSSESTGGDGAQNPYQVVSGVTAGILVGSHSAMTTLNGKSSWFILTTDEVKFNDMNKNQNSGIVMFSPKQVNIPAKDGNYVLLYALKDVIGRDKFISFVDEVGYHLTAQGDCDKYNIVNNYFIGGIKTLYQEPQASDDEESTEETITVTDTDKDRNRSLEMVSFENWSKSVGDAVEPDDEEEP